MSKSSTSSMPGVDAMTDSLEFVKNMWGGMKIPGMAMPTLSVDDINKQITDLKAVESWLTLNMSMLRGTIQALEVQSATIATLQSMSESMSAMIKPVAKEEKSAFETPFSFSAPDTSEAKPEPTEAAAQSPSAEDPAALAATFVNPAAWWNMLQDQFKQAVNTAMVPEPEAAPAPKKSPQTKPKPAAKRSTAGAASAATRKRKSPSKS